jgi:hypothetical protein
MTIYKHYCKLCDYSTDKKSSIDKHLLSRKHICNTTSNLCNKKIIDNSNFVCSNCENIYNSRITLWRHKKTCTCENNNQMENIILDSSSNEIKILTNLIFEIVKSNTELQKQTNEFQKQNHELQKQVLDICQKIQPGTNINNNNSHNKTFNLNFFLNEQCKDAMNIMEFVDTFQLQFSDLERIGEVGYVEGISSIIINKLNEMDVYKRPIHCSDAKREIMYVKDNDVWDKDNETNDKIRLAIRYISKKNSELVIPWRDLHPGVRNYDHRLNDKYQEIIIQSLGGKNTTTEEGETKIIRKISKMVLINKSM